MQVSFVFYYFSMHNDDASEADAILPPTGLACGPPVPCGMVSLLSVEEKAKTLRIQFLDMHDGMVLCRFPLTVFPFAMAHH